MNAEKAIKKNKKIEGIISTTSRGVGYVSYPDYEEDIEIAPEKMGQALDGDTVLVEILASKSRGRIQGRVSKILKRARDRFVGVLVDKGDGYLFRADNKKIYTLMKFEKYPHELNGDEKVVVEWHGWEKNEEMPRVELVDVLGKAFEHEVEMKAILISKNIDTSFPNDVLREAQAIHENAESDFHNEIETSERKDMREVLTFTIDPKTAKDFDDAISIQKTQGNEEGKSVWEIGVHIADVSHYVEPKSAIDKEARKRGFSTYLVDRTIPMLPEVLSNDLCSLNPHEDRLAFSAVFEMNEKGVVLSRWFGKTIIHSDRRFTYEEAQDSIDNEGEHGDVLTILNSIAKVLRKERFANGAIDFADDEVSFELDGNGNVLSIQKKERLDTHKLVEEYMLLANKEVARKIDSLSEDSGRDLFFMYRVHDVPDRERLEELGIFLRALGYEFHVEEEIDPKDINAILEAVRGKAEEGVVSSSLLRSMAKAVYSTTSKGHFGLAFEYYTHFTSPIRRYPDLIVHRLLEQHLNGTPIPRQELVFYQKAALDLSDIERTIMEAERESIKYKQVEYLSEHVGETFDALITGVSDYGFYVEEQKTKASGMVNVRDLHGDYFELDRKHYAIVGKDSKKSYRIGDSVRVKLKNADLEKRQLDFTVVSEK